jgi:hypothetical protein
MTAGSWVVQAAVDRRLRAGTSPRISSRADAFEDRTNTVSVTRAPFQLGAPLDEVHVCGSLEGRHLPGARDDPDEARAAREPSPGLVAIVAADVLDALLELFAVDAVRRGEG